MSTLSQDAQSIIETARVTEKHCWLGLQSGQTKRTAPILLSIYKGDPRQNGGGTFSLPRLFIIYQIYVLAWKRK